VYLVLRDGHPSRNVHSGTGGHQTHDRSGEHRLAGSRLTDHAQRFPGMQPQRDVRHRTHRATRSVEHRVQFVHCQHCGTVHSCPLLGSHLFRAFSPTRLNENTGRNRNTPGTRTMCGCWANTVPSPSAIMFPHVGAGGGTPGPRKLRDASATINTEIITMASDRIGNATLGNSSLVISRHREAPIALAARTNPRSAKAIVLARASRTMLGIVNSDNAIAMLRRFGSSTAASAISRISGGTASTAFVPIPTRVSTPFRKNPAATPMAPPTTLPSTTA